MKITVDRIARESCPDGKTCPALGHADDGRGFVVGKPVHDPEALAAFAIGPDEILVEVPPSLAVWRGDLDAQ